MRQDHKKYLTLAFVLLATIAAGIIGINYLNGVRDMVMEQQTQEETPHE